MLKEVGGDGANEGRLCWPQGGSWWTIFGVCGGKPWESLKQGSDKSLSSDSMDIKCFCSHNI